MKNVTELLQAAARMVFQADNRQVRMEFFKAGGMYYGPIEFTTEVVKLRRHMESDEPIDNYLGEDPPSIRVVSSMFALGMIAEDFNEVVSTMTKLMLILVDRLREESGLTPEEFNAMVMFSIPTEEEVNNVAKH